MNLIKRSFALLLVMILLVSGLLVVQANAQTNSALCFVNLTSISELNDGEAIQLKSQNGSAHLVWFMNIYRPTLRLQTTVPAVEDNNSYFYVKKHSASSFSLYMVSPYDGMKYYISSNFSAEDPQLKTEQEAGTNNIRWYIYENNGTYQFVFGNDMIPISMYLLGNASLTSPTLDTYGAGNFINSLNWYVKKSIPVTLTYTRTSYWGTGFEGSITITNNSSTTINNWSLECQYAYDIGNIWNAQVASHVNYHYVINNAGWNSSIPSGQSVTFGFSGTGGDGAYDPWIIFVINN